MPHYITIAHVQIDLAQAKIESSYRTVDAFGMECGGHCYSILSAPRADGTNAEFPIDILQFPCTQAQYKAQAAKHRRAMKRTLGDLIARAGEPLRAGV